MSGFIRAITDAVARFDMRAWFTLLLFGLVWKILTMIEDTPALLESAPFMQLVGPIAGAGGLLLIASFLYGSNKESAQKSEALRDNASTMRQAGIPVGGQPKEPVDVNVINPYADKTDEELHKLLADRGEDPTGLDRDAMLAKLAELDKSIPTEPRA